MKFISTLDFLFAPGPCNQVDRFGRIAKKNHFARIRSARGSGGTLPLEVLFGLTFELLIVCMTLPPTLAIALVLSTPRATEIGRVASFAFPSCFRALHRASGEMVPNEGCEDLARGAKGTTRSPPRSPRKSLRTGPRCAPGDAPARGRFWPDLRQIRIAFET